MNAQLVVDLGARIGWVIPLVAALTVYFVLRYWYPAFRLGRELDRCLSALRRNATADGAIQDPRAIRQAAFAASPLRDAWDEYAKTLHGRTVDAVDPQTGERVEKQTVRSTSPSEAFFTEQSIIDVRIHADFFRHLPGLLTGIGIIGTFFGLIGGLKAFGVSGDPVQAQQHLQTLMRTVGDAFVSSVSAIGAAMLVTFAEKVTFAGLVGRLLELRERIDRLFEGGVGEEYLERLVRSSESSDARMGRIKDELVENIRTHLETMAERAREEQRIQAEAIPERIGSAIREHLGEPMRAIAGVVRDVGGDQSESASRVVENLMVAFTERMDQIFGAQMATMTAVLKDAAEAMGACAREFSTLTDGMGESGARAVEAMGGKLAEALDQIDARGRATDERMRAFLEEMRSSATSTQDQTQAHAARMFSDFTERMGGFADSVRALSGEHAAQAEEQRGRLARSAEEAVGDLRATLERTLAAANESTAATREAVRRLGETTSRAVEGLDASARSLETTFATMRSAGETASAAFDGAALAGERMLAAAGVLQTASAPVRDALTTFGESRDRFAALLGELGSLVDNAKREASLTSDFVARIERAAEGLRTAQGDAGEYLANVSQVLEKGFATFSSELFETIRHANAQFTDSLSGAVASTADAVKSLEDLVEALPAAATPARVGGAAR